MPKVSVVVPAYNAEKTIEKKEVFRSWPIRSILKIVYA